MTSNLKFASFLIRQVGSAVITKWDLAQRCTWPPWVPPGCPKFFADPEVVRFGFNPSPKNTTSKRKNVVFTTSKSSNLDSIQGKKHDLKAKKRRFYDFKIVESGFNPRPKNTTSKRKNVVFLIWIESKSDDFGVGEKFWAPRGHLRRPGAPLCKIPFCDYSRSHLPNEEGGKLQVCRHPK